ncbi:MFS transporter [Pseudonocardia bannensis]|uniref:MFS transporter n=2 Tax=Pseudonocardia bannensis TaxID=630973 RepID=A0A848DNK6_9PSEU|nr:MFS transporter [Pseudonocardia bannensis]
MPASPAPDPAAPAAEPPVADTASPSGPPPRPASEPTARRRYPWHDDPDYDPAEYRRNPPPAPQWRPPPSGPQVRPPDPRPGAGWSDADDEPPAAEPEPPRRPGPRMPRKLTVTRVAALRSRQITENGIRAFRRAATADGADRSGLTALTYATMMTYAVDAAVAVALANTLFFAAATAESKTNVALYLAITVAPFALVAPVIGPLLDRLQRGRRAALAVSFGGRAVLAVVMALNYDNWLLYPAALGTMVLSKSYVVLKAAVTPRVLPERITLVTTNSRLTAFGLASGAVFGGIGGGVAAVVGSEGALFYTAGLAVVGTLLCLRIPRWVEVTAGEVPAALRSGKRDRRRPTGRHVLVALWGNGSIRVLTGFLTLFVAFVVKAQTEEDPARQLLLIGVVGAAAGLGAFTGNAVGSRQRFGHADAVVLACISAACASAVVAAVLPGIVTAAIVGLVAATCSALAKVCLDAVIQRDLPEESRASAFGRSETVLQLAWVFGGALGVLLPHSTFWIGFTVVSAVVALAGTQTAMISRGRSLVPGMGVRAARPDPQPAAR